MVYTTGDGNSEVESRFTQFYFKNSSWANHEMVPVGERALYLSMEKKYDYVTKLDIKFDHLEKIDIQSEVDAVEDKWFNQTLTKVNESVVRLGVVEGEYHWHKHENDDEFFFVLDGQLLIDLEDRTIELNPNQGVTIPRGERHRPRAPPKTVVLMVETSTIEPTGD